MSILNIEIKARCDNPAGIKSKLESQNARFAGIDHQIDTYFKANEGRLKLREGNIENTLIHYLRTDQAGPKQSLVELYHPEPNSTLKEVLTKAMGVLAIVDKHRAIYFVDNVKFHIDKVKGLGSFVEIEAIDTDGNIGEEKLLRQCNFYLELFGIDDGDLIERSYSDLILENVLAGGGVS
ncbi:MAG: adenylate cyclase class 2 [Saprospiraceae bacterium]|jgi:adenylate cyclase class 2